MDVHLCSFACKFAHFLSFWALFSSFLAFWAHFYRYFAPIPRKSPPNARPLARFAGSRPLYLVAICGQIAANNAQNTLKSPQNARKRGAKRSKAALFRCFSPFFAHFAALFACFARKITRFAGNLARNRHHLVTIHAHSSRKSYAKSAQNRKKERKNAHSSRFSLSFLRFCALFALFSHEKGPIRPLSARIPALRAGWLPSATAAFGSVRPFGAAGFAGFFFFRGFAPVPTLRVGGFQPYGLVFHSNASHSRSNRGDFAHSGPHFVRKRLALARFAGSSGRFALHAALHSLARGAPQPSAARVPPLRGKTKRTRRLRRLACFRFCRRRRRGVVGGACPPYGAASLAAPEGRGPARLASLTKTRSVFFFLLRPSAGGSLTSGQRFSGRRPEGVHRATRDGSRRRRGLSR